MNQTPNEKLIAMLNEWRTSVAPVDDDTRALHSKTNAVIRDVEDTDARREAWLGVQAQQAAKDEALRHARATLLGISHLAKNPPSVGGSDAIRSTALISVGIIDCANSGVVKLPEIRR